MENDVAKMKIAELESNIRAKTLRLLAQRDYSRSELEKKIRDWLAVEQRNKENGKSWRGKKEEEGGQSNTTLIDFDNAEERLQHILDAFEARGWISDARVVEVLLHQKASRLGSARLRQKLEAKGLSEQLVQDALKNIKETEFDRACHVWLKKFEVLPADASSYSKQMRFLVYRGFAPDIARQVLNGQWIENEIQ